VQKTIAAAAKGQALTRTSRGRLNPSGQYRILFGSNQVSNTFSTAAAARQEMRNQREYDRRHNQSSGVMRLQKKDFDTGEWVTLERSDGRRNPGQAPRYEV
jgi:hypothetical protein